MKLVRIREAKPMDGHRVQLTLTDGRVIERDLGPMLAGPVFSQIRSDQACRPPREPGTLPRLLAQSSGRIAGNYGPWLTATPRTKRLGVRAMTRYGPTL